MATIRQSLALAACLLAAWYSARPCAALPAVTREGVENASNVLQELMSDYLEKTPTDDQGQTGQQAENDPASVENSNSEPSKPIGTNTVEYIIPKGANLPQVTDDICKVMKSGDLTKVTLVFGSKQPGHTFKQEVVPVTIHSSTTTSTSSSTSTKSHAINTENPHHDQEKEEPAPVIAVPNSNASENKTQEERDTDGETMLNDQVELTPDIANEQGTAANNSSEPAVIESNPDVEAETSKDENEESLDISNKNTAPYHFSETIASDGLTPLQTEIEKEDNANEQGVPVTDVTAEDKSIAGKNETHEAPETVVEAVKSEDKKEETHETAPHSNKHETLEEQTDDHPADTVESIPEPNIGAADQSSTGLDEPVSVDAIQSEEGSVGQVENASNNDTAELSESVNSTRSKDESHDIEPSTDDVTDEIVPPKVLVDQPDNITSHTQTEQEETIKDVVNQFLEQLDSSDDRNDNKTVIETQSDNSENVTYDIPVAQSLTAPHELSHNEISHGDETDKHQSDTQPDPVSEPSSNDNKTLDNTDEETPEQVSNDNVHDSTESKQTAEDQADTEKNEVAPPEEDDLAHLKHIETPNKNVTVSDSTVDNEIDDNATQSETIADVSDKAHEASDDVELSDDPVEKTAENEAGPQNEDNTISDSLETLVSKSESPVEQPSADQGEDVVDNEDADHNNTALSDNSADKAESHFIPETAGNETTSDNNPDESSAPQATSETETVNDSYNSTLNDEEEPIGTLEAHSQTAESVEGESGDSEGGSASNNAATDEADKQNGVPASDGNTTETADEDSTMTDSLETLVSKSESPVEHPSGVQEEVVIDNKDAEHNSTAPSDNSPNETVSHSIPETAGNETTSENNPDESSASQAAGETETDNDSNNTILHDEEKPIVSLEAHPQTAASVEGESGDSEGGSASIITATDDADKQNGVPAPDGNPTETADSDVGSQSDTETLDHQSNTEEDVADGEEPAQPDNESNGTSATSDAASDTGAGSPTITDVAPEDDDNTPTNSKNQIDNIPDWHICETRMFEKKFMSILTEVKDARGFSCAKFVAFYDKFHGDEKALATCEALLKKGSFHSKNTFAETIFTNPDSMHAVVHHTNEHLEKEANKPEKTHIVLYAPHLDHSNDHPTPDAANLRHISGLIAD